MIISRDDRGQATVLLSPKMPFTLFKFPTLFGRKQNSYKLDRSVSWTIKIIKQIFCDISTYQSIVPIQLDLEEEDPVILCHSKPSFTTFGYNRYELAGLTYSHNLLTFSYYYSLDHPQSFASIKPIQGGSKPKPVMPPSLPTYQYHIKTGDLRYIFSCQIRKMIFSLIAVNTH